MVPKSKVLGEPALALVSTGSTKFPFSRLFMVLAKVNKDKCQIVNGFLPTDKMISYIKKADKIIIHGGPATIYNVVKYARVIPLVVPRRKKFKEHVDDHQFFFCKYLMGQVSSRLRKYFILEDAIEISVKDYLSKKTPKNDLKKYLFIDKNKEVLIKKLHIYTES